MRKLVQNRVGQSQLLVEGHGLAASELGLRESNAGNIFHGAGVELWHEDLIVLCELVWDAEEVFVEAHADQGGGEHLIKNLWLNS